MADNVAITAGAGTNVATDDVSSVHYQKIKLDLGGDGVADPAVADLAGKVPTTSQGTIAHDGVDSGRPVKIGYRSVAHGATPTAVAAADRTDALANREGVPWVIGGAPNIVCATYITTAGQTDDNVLPAISAGTKYVITRITFTLDAAGTVNVAVRVGFGATTVPALGASAADAVAGILFYHPGAVPGSMLHLGDGSGILGIGGDGEELRITCGAPTGGTLAVSVSYYTTAS